MASDLNSPKFWLGIRAAVLMITLVLIGSALASGWDKDGGRDWDYFQADLLSARQSVLDNGELPLWMPHRSGGHDAFADPQSAWLSPLGLLVLIFDFPVGARLFLIGCACLGTLGTMQLGKQLKLSIWASGLMSAIMYLSMPMGLYAAGGIPNFSLGLAILPWIVLLVHRSTPWSTVGAGSMLAIALYHGDPNHFVWHSVFLALFGIGLSVAQRTWKPAAAVLMTVASAFLFALPKALPMWLMSRENPRFVDINGASGITLRQIYHAFLHPFPPYLEQPHGEFVCLLRSGELVSYNYMNPRLISQIVPGTRCDWVNFGCYIGWLSVLLVVAGTVTLILSIDRKAAKAEATHHRSTTASTALPNYQRRAQVERPLTPVLLAVTFASLIFFWLSLGTHVSPSLWALLHRLPVFSSMKSPERLLVYLLLPLALLAAIGLDGLIKLAHKRLDENLVTTLTILLVALIVLDVHLPTRHLYRAAFCEPSLVLPTISPHCYQHQWDGRDNTSTLYAAPVTPAVRADKGLVNGYTIFNSDTNVVACSSGAKHAEIEAPLDDSAVVDDIKFTARSISFRYQADKPVEFTINQNWYRGWQVVQPKEAIISATRDNRISLKAPPSHTMTGRNIIRLQYTSPGLYHGILFSMLILPFWLFGIHWLHRRLRRDVQTT